MPFRFVHTADIHFDSPLRSLALRDGDLAELVGGATRQAFERTIDLCLDERVDVLMIAGDLYDGDQTSMKTALFLAAQLQRLDEAGLRTFIVRGNHDAESRITREIVLPEGVTVFGGRGAAVPLDRPGGAIPRGTRGQLQEAPRSRKPRSQVQASSARRFQHRRTAHEPRGRAGARHLCAVRRFRTRRHGVRLLVSGPRPQARSAQRIALRRDARNAATTSVRPASNR